MYTNNYKTRNNGINYMGNGHIKCCTLVKNGSGLVKGNLKEEIATGTGP